MYLITFRPGTPREEVESAVSALTRLGFEAQRIEAEVPLLLIRRDSGWVEAGSLGRLPGVLEVVRLAPEWRLAGRDAKPGGTTFRVRELEVGKTVLIAAGPCVVEDEKTLLDTARAVRQAGGHFLRGGAFKPRTSPYAFHGEGAEGLAALRRARDETSLPVITECLDPRQVEAVAETADILQIGARSMQNFPLLREAGRAGKPVLLKRGLGATLEEWLLAAEHVLLSGEERVILCERGVRGIAEHSRFTLDLAVLPRLREETHLPIWVDPSHATGRAASVPAMARAAVAAGADGLLLEVHPDPAAALSDGAQALGPAEFQALVPQLRAVAAAVGRTLG